MCMPRFPKHCWATYFEKLIYKQDLIIADAKQESKHKIWFTLIVEALNRYLYHVIISTILIILIYSCIYSLYLLFIWIFIIIFFITSHFLLCAIFYILICFFV